MNYKFNNEMAGLIVSLCTAFQYSRKGSRVIKETKRSEYDFVPSTYYYIRDLISILNQEKIKEKDCVLDLGCGLSPVLTYLYREHKFTNLYGVENQKELVRGAWYLPFTALLGDLTKPDDKVITLINKAKVIYLYMPIANSSKYETALRRVAKHMKKGAIIMDLYGPMRDAFRKTKTVKEYTVDAASHIFYYKKL